MKHPKITIVTPSFNQAQYIEQTIDSVLSQNYPNLEYIVIDGNSKDNSASLIKKYEKHLSFWVSEPDRGQSHAINKGIQKATGDIFNWINSDDYLEPNSLKIIAESFENPSVNVVCGRSNVIQDGKLVRVSNGTDIYPGNLAKTIGWCRIDQPETYFRLNIVKQLGLLNEHLHFVMDKEIWMRYLLRYGLGGELTINTIIANFRLHASSKTQSQSSSFATDTNTIFYQMALQNRMDIEASFVKGKFDIRPIEIKTLESAHSSIVKSALHYFLLYKSDELYYNDQSSQAKKIIDFVDRRLLKEEDLPLLKKLQFRTRIPQSITTLLRKWKSV